MFERAQQIRRREGRIDQQRHAIFMRDLGYARDVQHIEPGVAERFAEKEPRVRARGRAPCIEIVRRDEGRVDPEALKRVVQQVVRAAVKRA